MNTLTIAKASTREKHQAIAFVQAIYLEKFSTSPAVSDTYIIARRGRTIIGALGIDFADTHGRLPYEKIYKTDTSTHPFSTHKETSIQFGKWVHTERDQSLSSGLGYTGCLYALLHSKKHMWSIHTDGAARLLKKKGVRLFCIHDAVVCTETISPNDIDYYTQIPPPKCYVSDIQQIRQALFVHTCQSLQEKRIAIDHDSF